MVELIEKNRIRLMTEEEKKERERENKILGFKSNIKQHTYKDRVRHPDHYTWLKEKCGIEVIDLVRHLDMDRGCAIKYILRCGLKPEEGMTANEKAIQDIDKAIEYLVDYKEHILKKQKSAI